MAFSTFINIDADAGGVYTFDPQSLPDVIFLQTASAPMAADLTLQLSATALQGQSCKIFVPLIDNKGFNIDVFGFLANTPTPASALGWVYTLTIYEGGTNHMQRTPLDFTDTSLVSGDIIQPATLTLARIEDLTSAHLIVGNASNRPTSVAVTGDVTITNAGITAIGAGVIVNADINASAAIATSKLAAKTASTMARYDASGYLTDTGAFLVNADVNASAAIAYSKMAALTASQVMVTSAGGVATTAATVSATLGGTALNTSASTGVPVVTGGTWSVGARTEVMHLQVSFESGYVGDFKITMPFAGTVTSIYAYATKVIAGTDNGTIQMKNNGGTSTTGGLVTFTASDARGTAYTATPTANNTFIAGDILNFFTAKATAGGVVQLSITYTRLT